MSLFYLKRETFLNIEGVINRQQKRGRIGSFGRWISTVVMGNLVKKSKSTIYSK